MSYLKLGKEEGAELLGRRSKKMLEGDLAGGYYIQPTIFKGHNKMRFSKKKFWTCISRDHF
jgi:aldehyde dehydrogenase